MDALRALVDFILHIDTHLSQLAADYGPWLYGILALIVFCETGLVVTPFLPGDSLLFAAGALAASGSFNVHLLALIVFCAAILGDTVNYTVGRQIGGRVARSRFVRPQYLARTQAFYAKHGGRMLVLARFIPIVRTFAPFVAGTAEMPFPRFIAYCLAGGALWVLLFVYAGYFFGNLPVVKENFGLVAIAIVALSVLPVGVEYLRSRRAPASPEVPR